MRGGQSPEFSHQQTRASGRGRANVPPPPEFYEELVIAAMQAGAAIQAQQTQFMGSGGNIGGMMIPHEPNQPQGEPEPELPGAGEPSEAEDVNRTSGRDSDGETLHLEQGDGSDYPDHTDTDPYEDPTSSQAEVEPSPDVEHIEVEDSPDEVATCSKQKRRLQLLDQVNHHRQQLSLPQVRHKNRL